MEIYWLEQRASDVPEHDEWLSDSERVRLAAMHVAKRRTDWRLGRWTAKLALCSWDGLASNAAAMARNEVRAAISGAPEAYVNGEPAELALSLSHSNDSALCVLARDVSRVGCDIETLEPRTPAFVDDYFTEDEQRLVADASETGRILLVNLIWSAKESALKALGLGLRESTRAINVSVALNSPVQGGADLWHRFTATARSGEFFHGLWRATTPCVRTMVADHFISRATELQPTVVSAGAEIDTGPWYVAE